MKNTLTIFGVLFLAISMVMPAYAIEHQLGGYVRVRTYTAGDWTANDSDSSKTRSQADSRSHITYTAKINEDFAVYTELRMDSIFGSDAEGKQSGLSGVTPVTLKLQHSYMDFKLNETNILVGKQSFFEARGLLLYDAAPGIRIKCPLSDQLTLDAKWIKFGEGGEGVNAHQDVDTFAITPEIKLNDNIKIKPYLWYATSRGMNNGEKSWNLWWSDINQLSDLDMYYLGFDFDATMGDASIWFTTLYQAGSANIAQANADDWNGIGSVDFSGIAALGGGSLNLGKITLSGQLFFASGDDEKDDKIEQFFSAEAGYYYWSEIMGLGSNDDAVPNNIGWSLSNIMGGGGTLGFCATDDINLTFGLWYAAAVEDFQGQTGLVEADDYGIEVNAMLDYSLMDNLSLSLIGAYVMAGDAMTEENVEGSNIEGADPYFMQAQIKASF
jgi:hypothetical protein